MLSTRWSTYYYVTFYRVEYFSFKYLYFLVQFYQFLFIVVVFFSHDFLCSLYSDFNNHRLAVVSSRDSCEMKCYGGEGNGEGFFCRPQGVTVDNEGYILVCDSRNNRVQVRFRKIRHFKKWKKSDGFF